MQVEVRGQTIELEPNSKPYLLKRLIADAFDIVLIFLLFTIGMMLLMQTPLANVYNGHAAEAKRIETEAIERNGGDTTKAAAELQQDAKYRDTVFAAKLHLFLLQAAMAFLVEGILFLLIPLVNRDRQTPGKMLTGIMPFHERKMSRIKWYQILYRFLFIFILDSLVIYLNMEVWTFLIVPVFRLIEMLVNEKNKTIMDFITGVLIIEKKSYDGIQ